MSIDRDAKDRAIEQVASELDGLDMDSAVSAAEVEEAREWLRDNPMLAATPGNVTNQRMRKIIAHSDINTDKPQRANILRIGADELTEHVVGQVRTGIIEDIRNAERVAVEKTIAEQLTNGRRGTFGVEDAKPEHEKSCEDRIESHKDGRIADFRVLAKLAENGSDRLDALAEDDATRAMLAELDISDEDIQHAAEGESSVEDDVSERARERMDRYPIGVSKSAVFRIDLSTGGPGDWLEVICSGNTPCYESAENGEHYEIDRIVYHFNDWFDHAERELHGDDLKAAEAFASEVVSELIG